MNKFLVALVCALFVFVYVHAEYQFEDAEECM